MNENIVYRNNIDLTVYNFQKDIENRLFMGELAPLDIEVLQILVDGSLKTSLSCLAQQANLSVCKLLPIIKKFETIRLVSFQGEFLLVDKEQRKYYEAQLNKFQEQFEPNLQFFQGLLSKVPIHILPHWYSLPAMPSNIFFSIIERLFGSAKTYSNYLRHISLPFPVMHEILKDLFASPNYEISVKKVMEKYSLGRGQFEEIMLQLEYNFVCCSGYRRSEKTWEEVITPIHEWRTYLDLLRHLEPRPIENSSSICSFYQEEMNFLREISLLVEVIMDSEMKLINHSLSIEKNLSFQRDSSSTHAAHLLKRMTGLELVIEKGNYLVVTEKGQEWLKLSEVEQLQRLVRLQLSELSERMRDYSELIQSLNVLENRGWFFFDDFVASLTIGIGDVVGTTLQTKGKKWKYLLPVYGEQEIDFIRNIIFVLLFERGIVNIGTVDSRPCFQLLCSA